jgi:hypothetical protein
MRLAIRSAVRPGPRDVRRNPLTCAIVTAMLAGTVWLGMVWMAQQIHF